MRALWRRINRCAPGLPLPDRGRVFLDRVRRVAVLVEPAESPSTTVNFNTNPAPGQNVQTARVGDYTITLKTLDPRHTCAVAATRASANMSSSSAVASTCGDTRSTGAAISNGARCTSA